QINPIQLTPDNIYAFLVNQPVTKTTRQRHMSAMRKMLKILSINYQSPALKAAYEYLCEITVPEEGISVRERKKLALTPAQTEKVLNFWNQPERRADNVELVVRNHALLNLALATGARSSGI